MPPAISTSYFQSKKFLLKLKFCFYYFLVYIDNISFLTGGIKLQLTNSIFHNMQPAFALVYYYAFLSLFSFGYSYLLCWPGAGIGLIGRPNSLRLLPFIKNLSSRLILSTNTKSRCHTMCYLAHWFAGIPSGNRDFSGIDRYLAWHNR